MNFYYLFENHFKVVLPELFLSLALVGLLMYGLFLKPAITSSSEGDNIATTTAASYQLEQNAATTINVNWLSIYTLLITFALVLNNPIGKTTIFNNLLIHDPLTSLVKGFVLLGAFASLIISNQYFKFEKLHAFEYSILVLMATDALLLLVSAYDLISIYMAIELQALSLYVLAASKRNSEFSTEAGLKYFILGAFSSGLLLFGISIIYGFTGMTNLGDLVSFFISYDWAIGENHFAAILAVIFISTAFLFKLAVVPFHMWAPDVYEGAPTSVTAFFAITPKVAIFLVLFRFYFYAFYGFSQVWSSLIVALSMATMVVAAFAALYQTKIKRLLAYSAIGHVGYMLVGVATGTSEGIQAILAYALIYMITTIAVFAIILSLHYSNGMGVKYITDLAGLSKKNPALAAIMAIMLFSLAGIPPFAGFYGKLYLFIGAIESSMYLLAIVGVLSSVIGALYYIRIIKIMYFDTTSPKEEVNTFLVPDIEKSLVIAASTLFVVLFAVYPAPLLLLTQKVGFLFLI